MKLLGANSWTPKSRSRVIVGDYMNYRDFLRAVLKEKTEFNPQYSMRSFAKKLSISPALFSLVLAGKRNFSPSTACRCAERLELSPEDTRRFCLLVMMELADSSSEKDFLRRTIDQLDAPLDGVSGPIPPTKIDY